MDKFSFRRQAVLLLIGGVIALLILAVTPPEFKKEQLRFSRVRAAYAEKQNYLRELLNQHDLDLSAVSIYLQIFKQEEILELWCKGQENDQFKLVKTYPVCATSGELGPKRAQGDLQIPEGFYHIDRFNPTSSFYLSLGINYPNPSDRILGKKGSLGGDIFIHGACATIGCVPITDDLIKEIYLLSIEAKEQGQSKIPVTIYPAQLDEAGFKQLQLSNQYDLDKLNLWTDLKLSYDHFASTRQLPTVSFLTDGRHSIR